MNIGTGLIAKSLPDSQSLEFEIFQNVGAKCHGTLHVAMVKWLCGGRHADALYSLTLQAGMEKRLPFGVAQRHLLCAGEGPASWPGFLDVGALPLG